MPKRARRDPKIEALKKRGALHRRPERVTDAAFLDSDFFDARDLVQVKYEMVRRVTTEGYSVTKAAATFGFARPSLYLIKDILEREGLTGLLPKKRGPHSGHKLTDEVVDFLQESRAEDACLPATVLARKVQERFGVGVHPRSIDRALRRREKKLR